MKILFVTAPAQLNGFMQRFPHTLMADNAQLDLAIVAYSATTNTTHDGEHHQRRDRK